MNYTFLSIVALLANLFVLTWLAVQNYKNGRSEEIYNGYSSHVLTYLLSLAIIGLLVFVTPQKALLNVSGTPLQGNLKVDANITGLTCLSLPFLLLAILLSFLFLRIKGNQTKLSFVLFIIAIGQQVWLAFSSNTPQAIMIILAIWYALGAILIYVAADILASLLKKTYPDARVVHQKWLETSKTEALRRFNDPGERATRAMINPSVLIIDPAMLAGATIAYSIWMAIYMAVLIFL